MSQKVTIEQVAELLGVSRQTIYNWSHKNSTFPRCIKQGRINLWLRSDIEAWDLARFSKVSAENARRRESLLPRGGR